MAGSSPEPKVPARLLVEEGVERVVAVSGRRREHGFRQDLLLLTAAAGVQQGQQRGIAVEVLQGGGGGASSSSSIW